MKFIFRKKKKNNEKNTSQSFIFHIDNKNSFHK
jgi:hypothetical protein